MDVPDVEIDEADEEISGEGEAVGDGEEQQSMNFSDPDFDSSEVNFQLSKHTTELRLQS